LLRLILGRRKWTKLKTGEDARLPTAQTSISYFPS
jgi:hypothetical protein